MEEVSAGTPGQNFDRVIQNPSYLDKVPHILCLSGINGYTKAKVVAFKYSKEDICVEVREREVGKRGHHNGKVYIRVLFSL